MNHPEQQKHLLELANGKVFDDNALDCGQTYSVYKFHPEIGEFSTCCDAISVPYNHEYFLEMGKNYFEKHPEVVKTKIELRNNIKTSRCSLCWIKEEKGIRSMRQVIAARDAPENHQNPYLDVEKSYPNRIELWMNSTCNLGCFMCHMGNSNTLRKIWYEDLDSWGHDGKGFDEWTSNLKYNIERMNEPFKAAMHEWILDKIGDSKNNSINISYLGGEPTLHHEMFEHADDFISVTRDVLSATEGLERKIGFVTNGTSKDALNVRFNNLFDKYSDAGWIVSIMLSQDGVDDASQVRHGADSEQILKNFSNWVSVNSNVNQLIHFTVLTNLNIPYVHNLLNKIKDIIDSQYGDDPSSLADNKSLSIYFNACMDPNWLQAQILPKKFIEESFAKSMQIMDYLNKKYGTVITSDAFESIVSGMQESPPQEEVEAYFKKLHYVQRAYRKSYPDWDFYNNFPHLIEFAKDYNIERE